MNLGIPKNKKTEVIEGDAEDLKIREKAHILWTSSEGDKYFLTSCDEEPSKDTCGGCVERFNCRFSKSKEL